MTGSGAASLEGGGLPFDSPNSGPATQSPLTAHHSPVTLRAVLLSLALILGMCWWIAYTEIRTRTTEITCTALPIGVVFALFVVCLVNALIQRWRPGRGFTSGELATVYILVAVGSSVAGIGMVGFMTPGLANPVWFTNEAHWKEFADAVPAWWSPRDPLAIRDYYLGNSTLYTWNHIRAWLPVILTWAGFLLLILFLMLCLTAILRRQWIENERLSFPITYVPVAMALRSDGFLGLFRSRALIYGFAIPVILQTINNLNWLFPSIPGIPVKPTIGGPLDLGPSITAKPWNAMGNFPLGFHPNTIGLAYLLSTDVSFSCWFFYLVRKGLEVYCVAAGYRDAGASSAAARMPYTSEQGAGAWICLALVTIWLARRHLLGVGRMALGLRAPNTEHRIPNTEAMPYRLALLGALASFAGAVGFICWGGLPLAAAILLMALFVAYMLALTRIRAEVGTAWHFGPWVTAPELVVRTFGPMNLSVNALAVLAYHNWYNVDYRSMTTPHFFEGYKIADQGRILPRALTWSMVLAVAFGLLCASWVVLHLYYTYGASTAQVNPWRIQMARSGYQVMAGHVAETNIGTDVPGLEGVGAGAIVTLLLNAARTRFGRWPFHPAGYAVANTFIIDLLWFQFFLGWLAKWITLRYGGMTAYRRALPFFIGLILGDYVIASLWTFVGILLDTEMYRCFPN